MTSNDSITVPILAAHAPDSIIGQLEIPESVAEQIAFLSARNHPVELQAGFAKDGDEFKLLSVSIVASKAERSAPWQTPKPHREPAVTPASDPEVQKVLDEIVAESVDDFGKCGVMKPAIVNGSDPDPDCSSYVNLVCQTTVFHGRVSFEYGDIIVVDAQTSTTVAIEFARWFKDGMDKLKATGETVDELIDERR